MLTTSSTHTCTCPHNSLVNLVTNVFPISRHHRRIIKGIIKTLKVRLLDKNGDMVSGRVVTAALIRPVKEGSDHEVKLREMAPGFYQASLDLAFKGRWQVEVRVGDQFKMRHDLEVK